VSRESPAIPALPLLPVLLLMSILLARGVAQPGPFWVGRLPEAMGELLCVAQSLLTVLFDLIPITNRTIFTA